MRPFLLACPSEHQRAQIARVLRIGAGSSGRSRPWQHPALPPRATVDPCQWIHRAVRLIPLDLSMCGVSCKISLRGATEPGEWVKTYVFFRTFAVIVTDQMDEIAAALNAAGALGGPRTTDAHSARSRCYSGIGFRRSPPLRTASGDTGRPHIVALSASALTRRRRGPLALVRAVVKLSGSGTALVRCSVRAVPFPDALAPGSGALGGLREC